MASNEEVLQKAIIGILRVAERIVELPHEQREKAFKAAELSYRQTVSDSDYAEGDARHWVGAVMDTLRAEVADQARDETRIAAGHDDFASLERVMKLLVRSGSATRDNGSAWPAPGSPALNRQAPVCQRHEGPEAEIYRNRAVDGLTLMKRALESRTSQPEPGMQADAAGRVDEALRQAIEKQRAG